jgi:hypothetical protein
MRINQATYDLMTLEEGNFKIEDLTVDGEENLTVEDVSF